MAPNAPAASAKPDIISLDVLLSEIDEGRICIPRFQRPYVWTSQMMRELFESVLSGYPIGSLLFWVPQNISVPVMDHIGPIRVRKLGSPVSLVLDGHQRLATLFGVLRLPDSQPRGLKASMEQLNWWIGYDLEKEEIRQLRKAEDFRNVALLPLKSVLRTVEFVKFARAVDSDPSLSEQQKITYLDRADRVQRAVRDYRIALTIMRDGTINDAVAIFARVNRSGRRMTTDQMAVALTFKDGFNLEESLNDIIGDLGLLGFGEVNRSVIMQSLLQRAGRPFSKPNFDDLRNTTTQIALAEASGPAKDALTEAANFLREAVGIKSGRLLPYAHQLFLLGVFFSSHKERPVTSNRVQALKRWFWATSYEGWFASASSTDIEKSVSAMEAFAENDNFREATEAFDGFFIDRPLRPFPRTFDRRSARIRALLAVQIVRGQLLDPIGGSEVDGFSLMQDPSGRDLPYVFPSDGSAEVRSPANRMLLGSSHGRTVRRALLSGAINKLALLSQGINGAAYSALRRNNLKSFIIARENKLEEQENAFLSTFGLSIHTDIGRSDDDNDNEDSDQ